MKVLDASGIIHSDLDYSTGEYLITNSVLQEIASENAKTVVNQAIRNGGIKITDPKTESVKKAAEAAQNTGDIKKLSPADLDVLALALEKKAEIVSDDYGIQNVAALLKIKCHATAQDGIKKEYVWEKTCPGCGLKHSIDFNTCEVCGTKLKRVGKNKITN
jgi:UPF0271 protein